MPKKSIFRKRRSGLRLFVSCALLIAMIIVFLLTSISLINRDSEEYAMDRGNDFSRVAVLAVYDLFHDAAEHLYATAENISDSRGENEKLVSVSRHSVFDYIALYDDQGNLVTQQGRKANAEELWSFEYSCGNAKAAVSVRADESLSIVVNTADGGSLQGVFYGSQFDAVMASVFEENVQYVMYNDRTGRIFLNRTNGTETNYYDGLLQESISSNTEELLTTDETVAQIKGKHGDTVYYATQTRNVLGDMSVTIFIPQEYVGNIRVGARKLLLITGTATLGIVLSVFVFSGFMGRTLKKDDTFRKQEKELSFALLDMVCRDGEMIAFSYNRELDEIRYFFNGLDADSEKIRISRSIDAMMDALNLDIDDRKVFEDACRKQSTGKDSEFTLKGYRDEKELYLRLHLSIDENTGILMGTIADRTDEMKALDREAVEKAYIETMKPKCDSIWMINATQDRWRNEYTDQGDMSRYLGIHSRSWRDFTADQEEIISKIMLSEDFADMVEETNTSALIDKYRRGQEEVVFEYRIRKKDTDEYEWHRYIVRLYRNEATEDIMASMFIMNVDAEKKAEYERRDRKRLAQQTMTALSGLYYGLFYVELEKNMCYTTKKPGNDMITQVKAPFTEVFGGFIDTYVEEDYREEMHRVLTPYYLKKNLTEKQHSITLRYIRNVEGVRSKSKLIIQAARFENATVKDVVIALRSNND